MSYEYKRETAIHIVICCLLSIVIISLCFHFNIKLNESVAATIVQSITGYSFGALFLLAALPKIGFIRKLENNKSLKYYSLIIGFPAITGTVQLILASTNLMITFSATLFFMTALGFIQSIFILYLILINNSSPNKFTRKSYSRLPKNQ
jgi:hypothetical protein